MAMTITILMTRKNKTHQQLQTAQDMPTKHHRANEAYQSKAKVSKAKQRKAMKRTQSKAGANKPECGADYESVPGKNILL